MQKPNLALNLPPEEVARYLSNTNLIYEVVAGSTAYGTNRKGSDCDKRGVFILPPYYTFGFTDLEQARSPEGVDPDFHYYTLRKFLMDASNGAINWVEIFFTPEELVLQRSAFWQPLQECREHFLTKKMVKKTLGFMTGQTQRSMRTKEKVEQGVPPKDPNGRTLADNEVAGRDKKRQDDMYKNVAHALRAGSMIIELLETGILRVRRSPAECEALLAIRNREADLDGVYETVLDQVACIEENLAKSTLPECFNTEDAQTLLTHITLEYWRYQKWV